jgi:hypothetical protein
MRTQHDPAIFNRGRRRKEKKLLTGYFRQTHFASPTNKVRSRSNNSGDSSKLVPDQRAFTTLIRMVLYRPAGSFGQGNFDDAQAKLTTPVTRDE